jgi:hypothetical protein
MHVFCAGMYRSGSTWQYEIVSHLLEHFKNGRRRGVLLVEKSDLFDPDQEGNDWQSWKLHHGHHRFAAALESGRALAVYSYRDLRDVAYSMMHKFTASFEDVVEHRRLLHDCLEYDRFWRTRPRVLLQRYERFTAEPVRAIEHLAAHLEIVLNKDTAARLAREYSLAANKERTASLARQLTEAGFDLRDPCNTCRHDEHSLLHWNHIREGRIGGWRDQATPAQLERLAEICGDWLIAQGYAQDKKWTVATPAAA